MQNLLNYITIVEMWSFLSTIHDQFAKENVTQLYAQFYKV
jgi:hypothetical protein